MHIPRYCGVMLGSPGLNKCLLFLNVIEYSIHSSKIGFNDYSMFHSSLTEYIACMFHPAWQQLLQNLFSDDVWKVHFKLRID